MGKDKLEVDLIEKSPDEEKTVSDGSTVILF